jgi:hypothetical protein
VLDLKNWKWSKSVVRITIVQETVENDDEKRRNGEKPQQYLNCRASKEETRKSRYFLLWMKDILFSIVFYVVNIKENSGCSRTNRVTHSLFV